MSITKAATIETTPGGAGSNLMEMAHLKFIPEALKNTIFFIYAGSETQPPCHPKNWIVSPHLFRVTTKQVGT